MNATGCYFENVMADENSEIARGLRHRDPDLLDHLIEKYQHRLLRYLLHLTGRRELAEDFFQDTWIRVLERGGQYDGRHEFAAWLFTVARNLVVDHLRRKQPASLDGLADVDDQSPFDVPATGLPSALDLTIQREQNSRSPKAWTILARSTARPSCFASRKGWRWKRLQALQECQWVR